MPPRTQSPPVMRAVATDGHRLARYELELPDGAADMPGVIVPRKTVGELRKLLDDADGAIDMSLSDTKIQFGFNGVELTSKLIDGNFPPYERVIPSGNDKSLALEAKEFAQSVDRVSTISADKTRAVKLNMAKDKVTLVGGQSGKRHGHGRCGRDLQRSPAGDRLQRPLSAGHHRPDRRQGSALPAVGRGLARHHRRRGG